MDGRHVGADQLFAAATVLVDEAGPLEDGHVLLHGGEAHGIGAGQRRHRQLPVHGAAEDVPPGPVGERVEDQVGPVFGRRLQQIYNHLVVDYATPSPCQGGRLSAVAAWTVLRSADASIPCPSDRWPWSRSWPWHLSAAACGSSPPTSTTTTTIRSDVAVQAAVSRGAAASKTDASGIEWLCRPGTADDPCTADLTSTVQPESGPSTVQHAHRCGRSAGRLLLRLPHGQHAVGGLGRSPHRPGRDVGGPGPGVPVLPGVQGLRPHVPTGHAARPLRRGRGGRRRGHRLRRGAGGVAGLPGPLQPRAGGDRDRPLPGRQHAHPDCSGVRSTRTRPSASCWCRP